MLERFHQSLFPLSVVLCLSSGCAGPRLLTNEDPNADFGAYRTYGFVDPLGTDEHEYSSLLSEYLRATTSRELELRGYELSPTPDLLVNFYLHTAERTDLLQASRRYYDYRSYDSWDEGGTYVQVDREYTEGTINVDLVDRARSQVVWEATLIGRETDDTRRDLAGAVRRAITTVFAVYPYAAGESRPGTR